MALLIVLSAIAMVLTGLAGFMIRELRDLELLLADHDSILDSELI
jgi:hypothetical protein